MAAEDAAVSSPMRVPADNESSRNHAMMELEPLSDLLSATSKCPADTRDCQVTLVLLNYRNLATSGQPIRCGLVYSLMPRTTEWAPSVSRTASRMPTGSGSPSRCRNWGLALSNWSGTPVHVVAFSPPSASAGRCSRRTRAEARSICDCADSLKSAFAGCTTIRYSDGFKNCSSVLLSSIKFADCPTELASIDR